MRYRRILPVSIGLAVLAAVACTGGDSSALEEPSPKQTKAVATQTAELIGQATPMPESPTSTILLDDPAPRYLTFGWKTDFSRHSVPYREIMRGGPPRDGIPPIDNPKFETVADPPDYMNDADPVISLDINGEAIAYPLAILISHEIVNDEVGGIPVSVTYCPLCNTAIVFDRRVNGRILDFGTSGNLRKSDLVMWDRQTESWWQQITGEAIVGELTGTKLNFIPAPVVSWGEFAMAFPEGKLLSRDTGFSRNYDDPPYSGYDDLYSSPFLISSGIDLRLLPMERVVGLSIEGENVAYSFTRLQEYPVINDSINGQDLVVLYVGGTLSPFASSRHASNMAVGATAVYEPFVDGQKLTFTVQNDVIVDEETGSKWNILGQAVEGPLEGSQLNPVVHGNHFWFAWADFNPDTAVWTPEDLD